MGKDDSDKNDFTGQFVKIKPGYDLDENTGTYTRLDRSKDDAVTGLFESIQKIRKDSQNQSVEITGADGNQYLEGRKHIRLLTAMITALLAIWGSYAFIAQLRKIPDPKLDEKSVGARSAETSKSPSPSTPNSVAPHRTPANQPANPSRPDSIGRPAEPQRDRFQEAPMDSDFFGDRPPEPHEMEGAENDPSRAQNQPRNEVPHDEERDPASFDQEPAEVPPSQDSLDPGPPDDASPVDTY